MRLENIEVNKAKLSATNVEGRNEGKSFDDLVASIKEKGVLQPVLVRPTGAGSGGRIIYEVIAGNRRLAAAKIAGLEYIPAQIVEMNDIEAREAQIIENLQREDIHPLDEGEQYRELIEESKYEIPAVAAKVGKSESYVKQRLFLTNLEAKPGEAYRAGKINDGHAVLIAKLSTGDQTKALKAATSRYNLMTVKELKEWIEENIYSSLDNQPWLKSKELMKAVGECVECEPNRASLFGPVKEDACTDLKCWARKMEAYIDHRAKTEKLAKVSVDYGTPKKGIKGRDEYIVINKKDDRCGFVRGAIVAEGNGLGRIFEICMDKECKTHFSQRSGYSLTPKEKEARKKEREKAKKAKLDREKRLADALKKIKWPLKDKHLEALLELAFDQCSSLAYRTISKRHELKTERKKPYWDGGNAYYDYSGALKKFSETLDKTGRARLAFELLIDMGYDSFRKGIGKI